MAVQVQCCELQPLNIRAAITSLIISPASSLLSFVSYFRYKYFLCLLVSLLILLPSFLFSQSHFIYHIVCLLIPSFSLYWSYSSSLPLSFSASPTIFYPMHFIFSHPLRLMLLLRSSFLLLFLDLILFSSFSVVFFLIIFIIISPSSHSTPTLFFYSIHFH